jgi:hypothetical protein
VSGNAEFNLSSSSPAVDVSAGEYFEVRITESFAGTVDIQGNGDKTWAGMEIIE